MSTAIDLVPYDKGAVLIGVVSSTRILLVRDHAFPEPYWKLPGGSIEPQDSGIHGAAIRELEEETGLTLSRRQLRSFRNERIEGVRYFPHIYTATISEEELDRHEPEGLENGHPIEVQTFTRREIEELKLLQEHREEIFRLMSN